MTPESEFDNAQCSDNIVAHISLNQTPVSKCLKNSQERRLLLDLTQNVWVGNYWVSVQPRSDQVAVKGMRFHDKKHETFNRCSFHNAIHWCYLQTCQY